MDESHCFNWNDVYIMDEHLTEFDQKIINEFMNVKLGELINLNFSLKQMVFN